MLIWLLLGGSPFLRVIKLMKSEAVGEAGNEKKALPTCSVYCGLCSNNCTFTSQLSLRLLLFRPW